MKNRVYSILVFLCFAAALSAQNSTVSMKVKAVIVDRDLNQKAVPQLTVIIRKSADGNVAAEAKTSLEGVAVVQLEPGRYTLTTPRPLEFQGQSFSWEIEVDVSANGAELVLSNDNAKVTSAPRVRVTDELTSLFRKYQHSVVTVWSEFGHGTGFIIDSSGLIMTNQHVIGPSEYIAVQFDAQTKVPAVMLSKDAAKDIAVLWADLSKFTTAVPAPLSTGTAGKPSIEEGERVFTIGSPLSQRKIVTTGIASKIEARAIISDININPGNSGGPLFNSIGEVVGITTFGTSAANGPGVAGIVRIEEAFPLIELANKEMGPRSKPVATLLPVEPPGEFPIDAIKASAQIEKFDPKPYRMDVDKFDVMLITPILRYRYLASEVRAAKEKEKRTKKSKDAIKGTFQPLEDLKNWAEYAGEYKPVLLVRATPEFAETTGSVFLRALVSPYIAPKMRFKADFYKMKLFCGSREVQPIHPSKIAHVIDLNNQFVNATDASYEGLYVYPHDAINEKCGEVKLQLFTEKEPNKAREKILKASTIVKVTDDFRPYHDMLSAPGKN